MRCGDLLRVGLWRYSPITQFVVSDVGLCHTLGDQVVLPFMPNPLLQSWAMRAAAPASGKIAKNSLSVCFGAASPPGNDDCADMFGPSLPLNHQRRFQAVVTYGPF
ncbi:hypothetical protein SAMN04515618_104241 [Collimonas sp. OK307]|nr:hypothetical protein SAMN04515618_104241 [Collimonas sp. OK307]